MVGAVASDAAEAQSAQVWLGFGFGPAAAAEGKQSTFDVFRISKNEERAQWLGSRFLLRSNQRYVRALSIDCTF